MVDLIIFILELFGISDGLRDIIIEIGGILGL